MDRRRISYDRRSGRRRRGGRIGEGREPFVDKLDVQDGFEFGFDNRAWQDQIEQSEPYLVTWNPVDLQHLSFSTKENRAFRPSEDRSLKMARVMLYVLLILSTLFYAALFYMLASG